jgi:nucleotide-binding universal stress UspA family protein
MFTHILVPIDLSDRNARALRTALALARQSGARVTLLHVIHSVKDLPGGALRAFYRRLWKSSTQKLERAAAPLARKGVPVRTVVCIGEPAREIIRVALRIGVDLIVMGSHKVRPGRREARWGTTSYKVGIFCQCPILLVK